MTFFKSDFFWRRVSLSWLRVLLPVSQLNPHNGQSRLWFLSKIHWERKGNPLWRLKLTSRGHPQKNCLLQFESVFIGIQKSMKTWTLHKEGCRWQGETPFYTLVLYERRDENRTEKNCKNLILDSFIKVLPNLCKIIILSKFHETDNLCLKSLKHPLFVQLWNRSFRLSPFFEVSMFHWVAWHDVNEVSPGDSRLEENKKPSRPF